MVVSVPRLSLIRDLLRDGHNGPDPPAFRENTQFRISNLASNWRIGAQARIPDKGRVFLELATRIADRMIPLPVNRSEQRQLLPQSRLSRCKVGVRYIGSDTNTSDKRGSSHRSSAPTGAVHSETSCKVRRNPRRGVPTITNLPAC
ncbi:porin OmpL1 [Leptospira gomenensis]|uniref:porin OmpL1 n=1 Tax=Leptospira gomenensis TaxID=2484974 RepID=UPI003CCFEA06